MTTVTIPIDDFNLKIFNDHGTLRCNIWIHGKKAIAILKQITFKDAKKEWRRQLIIEQYEDYMP